MSAARRKQIVEALQNAQNRGIRIERGAQFDWCGSDGITPKACSALGAILLLCDPQVTAEGPHRWHLVGEHLGVGTYWEYRFHMGFDRHRILQKKIKGPDNTEKWITDSVSKMGFEISRQWVEF